MFQPNILCWAVLVRDWVHLLIDLFGYTFSLTCDDSAS